MRTVLLFKSVAISEFEPFVIVSSELFAASRSVLPENGREHGRVMGVPVGVVVAPGLVALGLSCILLTSIPCFLLFVVV
jgi:hypothetical protein